MNALIGVHGAQMTQAILLPSHAHVLELLPWIPDNYNIRGNWVQTRDKPTPLGIIFHNTDLNHLGYSLGRKSVPLCEGVGELGSKDEIECLTNERNKKQFIWESRNFNVNPEVILQYIKHFIFASSKECSKMTGALDRRFVLYNIWCEPEDMLLNRSSFNSNLHLKHYYDKTEEGMIHSHSSHIPNIDASRNAIDIVSLTIKDDFYTLFNSSAITSWVKHIQNLQSITFIGPASDYDSFMANLRVYLSSIQSKEARVHSIPIHWVNETHWINTYKSKYNCAYAGVCQQLIKLHIFDIKTLGISYIGNNILLVDSDTVWSRDVTFIHHENNTITYFERISDDEFDLECQGRDPVRFVEGITVGSIGIAVTDGNADEFNHKHTKTLYKSCRRPQFPNATGAKHIVHFMLFQYDVMAHLHATIIEAWGVSSVWEAVTQCHKHKFCTGKFEQEISSYDAPL